jgi:hypothetical protein
MVERLNSEPQNYPTGAAEALGRDVARTLIPLGRELLAQGRMREARGLFGRSLRRKRSPARVILVVPFLLNSRTFARQLAIKYKLKSLTQRLRLGQVRRALRRLGS